VAGQLRLREDLGTPGEGDSMSRAFYFWLGVTTGAVVQTIVMIGVLR
jgi:hypothetical protein